MMLDKGIGPLYLNDFLEIAGKYVDLAKFGWGTSALHVRELIQEKVESYLSYDITPYPGGTLFEIAYLQNKLEEFLDEADKLGFEAIEISDGTIDVSPGDREDVIAKVNDNGFLVITEVGKKDPKKDRLLSVFDRIKIINQDLKFGADLVLIEAREGGIGVGIYDGKGNVKEDELEIIQKNVELERIIWEAPQKNQQVYLILKFGANVNLGNIPSEDITALETMRRGLRGDTLGKVRL
jgi:phosphosulfolactate synthase